MCQWKEKSKSVHSPCSPAAELALWSKLIINWHLFRSATSWWVGPLTDISTEKCQYNSGISCIPVELSSEMSPLGVYFCPSNNDILWDNLERDRHAVPNVLCWLLDLHSHGIYSRWRCRAEKVRTFGLFGLWNRLNFIFYMFQIIVFIEIYFEISIGEFSTETLFRWFNK